MMVGKGGGAVIEERCGNFNPDFLLSVNLLPGWKNTCKV